MNDKIIDTDNINEEIRNLSDALVQMGKAVAEIAHNISNIFGNLNRDLIREYIIATCPNKRWVQMAFHAKKFRVRKKYMNKIIKYYLEVNK